jgi:Family of unknown function (DUF6356)
MQLPQLLTAHPASVGETYFQHLIQAARFGARLVLAGLACLIHSLLPFLFVHTARDMVKDLHEQIVLNRACRPAIPSTAQRRRAAP